MKIILINDYFFHNISSELMQEIEAVAPGCEVKQVEQKGITVNDLIDADIVFGRIPPHLLIRLPNLKWLHLASAGANGMTDRALYANKDIIVTKSSGTFGIPIAEHTIGMMIAIGRNFDYYYKKQFDNEWCSTLPNLHDISGETVLIIGLGDIGTETAKRLLSFDCRLIGMRRDATKPHEIISDIRPISDLHKTLPEADYVLICLPGTNETEKLFGKTEFKLMKTNAIIINVGRGMIIDTDALTEALNNGEIYGAGLDVTDPEPLPPDNPLWNARNILITPHVSAATSVTTKRRVMVFAELLKCYITGKPMYNFVDFDTGY